MLDDNLEIKEFFHARITRLDHFKETVEGIRVTLRHKPDLEEQFKASCFG